MPRRTVPTLVSVVAMVALLCPTSFSQGTEWASRVRTLVENNQFEQAMSLIDEWIKASPEDQDARGWHARVQAWTNHWSEAEAEYRSLLQRTPDDVDIMAGLADVLTWQKRFREALVILERACGLAPERNDCRLRLARVQQQLGQIREARSNYREILARNQGAREAQVGLAELREDGRHELRVGFDAGLLNYAQDAAGIAVSLRSRWNRRWSSRAALSQSRLYGESTTRFDADATVHFGAKNALTMGGTAARDAGIIPESEARFGFDRGFAASSHGAIRGVEASYQQRWAWYQGARLLVMSPGAILYLPNDWNWLIRLSATNTRFSDAGSDWIPGGWTRLTFPMTHRLKAYILFAAGVENFGLVDQIREYSARTWGGGLRIRLASGQEINGYAHYQRRSGAQAETDLGVSYVFRF